MSSVEFLQAGVRESLTRDTFTGPNVDKKVLPQCKTPNNDDTVEDDLTPAEKTEEVLSDPKFGMFSLFYYHWTRGHTNQAMKSRNRVYCSHIFSLLFALPVLVFLTQWLMYFSIVSHQVRTYDGGVCPNRAPLQEKIMMSAVAMFYFIKSFFLWDSIVDRSRRQKMIPSTSVIVMLDTLQEFGFNLLVYATNLWCIFTDPDFLNMFANTIVMEWLMDMDNEFERAYFSYLPGVAVDIYDNVFVSYRENLIMVAQRTQGSAGFRCCKRITWLPFKALIFLFAVLPVACFAFVFYGGLCK
tara:strand:- start:7757 stop:8650 length:894 start_codon:yes stop_codon:yes gene_type:complete